MEPKQSRKELKTLHAMLNSMRLYGLTCFCLRTGLITMIMILCLQASRVSAGAASSSSSGQTADASRQRAGAGAFRLESSRLGAIPGPSADIPAVPLPRHLEIVPLHPRTKAQHISLLEANLARLGYDHGKADSFEPRGLSLSSIAPAIRSQMVNEPGKRQFMHLYSSGPFDVVAMPLTAPELRRYRSQLRGFGGEGGTQKLAVIGFKHPNEAARARSPELMVKPELYGLIQVSRTEDLHSRLLAVPPEANVAYNLRQLLHY